MLRNKGINKISELQTSYTPNGVDCNSVLSGFKALKLTESFSAFKTIKEQGYGFKEILSVLILIVVHTEKTVHSYLSGFYGEKVAMGKDVFYRLKNRETICWRMILYHIATLFMNLTAANSTTGTDKSRYLIFDDTTIEKSGKKMEFIGRIISADFGSSAINSSFFFPSIINASLYPVKIPR